MAAFTSKANGNWSSGGQTTWNEVGVPGNGDTVTIGAHDVTVDVATIVGTSPNDAVTKAITLSSARALTVAAGVTLTVRGNLGMANLSGLTLQAGAAVVFDNSLSGGSPVYTISNAGFSNYTFNGTAVARCSLGAIVGQTMSISDAAWATVTMTFTDLLRISGFQIGNLLGDVTITDVTFTGCTEFRMTSSTTTLSFILRRLRFVGGIHATSDLRVDLRFTKVSGTREISGCVLPKTWTNQTTGFAIFGNYFGGGMESVQGVTSHESFRYNFLKQDGNLGSGDGQTIGASIHRNYLVCENLGGNPHFIAPQALHGVDTCIDQNVFEAQVPDLIDVGSCCRINPPATLVGSRIVGRNNIVVPGASTVMSGCMMALYDAAAHVRTGWYRNTANANNGSATGPRGAFATAQITGFADQLNGLKSNIVWGSSPSQGYVADRSIGDVKDIITPAGADRNWRHNLSVGDNQRGYDDKLASNTLWTAGDAVAAGVDANGVEADPQFVDDTRNLAAWNGARGYGAATYAAALVSLQADPSRVADLVAYVFEGFRVRNAAARNAAHDGGVVGAANYVKPTRYLASIENLGAYFQEKYAIAGSSVATEVPVSLSATVGMVRGISVTVGIR